MGPGGESKENGGLGFRDIRSFNVATLSKKCWHILKDQDSLLAKVFSQKYFPHVDFLNAKLGYRPSFARRSILAGHPLLKASLLWRIGNGQKVII